ncbi:MAG: hypothetical protein F4Z59_01795 [Gemmatimonadales bacterium]|nr:hypothetical protein [Gemmatimonadales bacterium]
MTPASATLVSLGETVSFTASIVDQHGRPYAGTVMPGASGAFQPGTWEVASGWILGSIAIGFVGAYIGGRVCARVAHDARGALILIGILVVLGVVSALMPVEAATGPRPDDVGMLEATMSANQPTWLTWLNPVIGVVGIWLGSRKLRE